MPTKRMIGLMVVLLSLPGWTGAVTKIDFDADTTEHIINLCTAAPDDPLYHQAINFCHGYLVGAYDFYEAAHSGPKGLKLVCLPDPPPSRNQAIQMFIEWVQAHPQYLQDNPVETEFRFLMEKYPCNP